MLMREGVTGDPGTFEQRPTFKPCNTEGAKEDTMNWDQIAGNWKQVKGKVKERWGDITDSDLDKIDGRREQLEGLLRERYGFAKDAASRNIDDWLKTIH